MLRHTNGLKLDSITLVEQPRRNKLSSSRPVLSFLSRLFNNSILTHLFFHRICQSIFSKLHANGWLEEQNKEQLYCEKDQRFLADRYVEGTCPICGADGARGDQCEICSTTYDSLELVNPRCSTCSTTPIARFSSHFFLKLKDLQPQIDAWVDKASAGGIWSANGRAFTSGWLRGGLENRCMTRDLVWGVKLPESLGEKWEKKVMYVWVSFFFASSFSSPS
jgi:methionyl-tRNA synthetase